MSLSIKRGWLHNEGRRVETVLSNYKSGSFVNKPKIVVMHFTYGGSARSSAKWFADRSNRGSSAHIVIDRDGSIIQCVNFEEIAWHAGPSSWRGLNGLNQYSIGIELANWGYLKRREGGWYSYTGVHIPSPIIARHKNGNPDRSNDQIGWEPYPAIQIEVAIAVVRDLIGSYGIDQIVGHDDIAPDRKWDPGPAFDMDSFRSRLFGGRAENHSDSFYVAVQEGLTLREGPGIQYAKLELLPQNTAVRAIERIGSWLMVSVLDQNGSPIKTGWVHSAYLSDKNP
jgi:N-acetylmuramoyl-L-alanine amidase